MSVENVVATIDMPSNHQGIVRPERKNSEVFRPDRRATSKPIASAMTKKAMTNVQSSASSLIDDPLWLLARTTPRESDTR